MKLRLLLVHPEMGVYLGSCMGLGFWSKLDPVGQVVAVTFESEKVVREVIDSWDSPIEKWCTVPVVADVGHYASQTSCIQSGVESWT